MTTLVVPGVRVEARFDVLPPLPAPSGILGAVGIVDRPPAAGGLIGVSKASELRQLLGPGTEVSMPEVVHALANGASEAVISPVAGGKAASLTLDNKSDVDAIILRCRSNGTWGNSLFADISAITDAGGNTIRVTLRLLRNGKVVETFSDLQVAAGQMDDFFDVINRGSRYIVAIDPGFESALPETKMFAFDSNTKFLPVKKNGAPETLFDLIPADGISPNGLSIDLAVASGKISLKIFKGGLQEEFTDLVMNPDSDNYLPYVLLTQSRYIRVRPHASLVDALPKATGGPVTFAGGESPTVQDYLTAIDLLSDDPRIDLVLASIEPGRDNAEVRQIHQALVAHAVVMSDNGAPRIAFGSVTRDEQANIGKVKDHAATVRNRRMVLVSPAGAEGAVAGAVGRMKPQFSPTFQPLNLHGMAHPAYRESQLNQLLGETINLLVVQDRAGRGVIVLRGIDTTGDQISVTRVADQCIRETKAIAENFIGRLNTDDARIALKQQIVSTFLRMERDNALVPSTDGSDPAFLVDVYSTQMDFAQGIVRIDIAVRPVRAIDYIYATIRVKN